MFFRPSGDDAWGVGGIDNPNGQPSTASFCRNLDAGGQRVVKDAAVIVA
jgi:hypothetical protein